MGKLLDIAASLLCIGAGIYLLSHNSPPIAVEGEAGQSWLEVLAHGIGIYFIGKGLFIARSTHLDGEAVAALRKLVQAAGLQHDRVGSTVEKSAGVDVVGAKQD